MANILFRGNVAPTQPVAVSGGSVAKNSPLTNDEGDWNYKALNDDIQTRAPVANPAFTGPVSYQYNLRSAHAAYNQYVSVIDATVTTTGCLIGEYLPSGDSQNATIVLDIVARTGVKIATSKATVSIRSNTMPAIDVTLQQERSQNSDLGLTIEVWKDATTGQVKIFAVPTASTQTISIKAETFERSNLHLFVLSVTNVAKNTSGLTQITDTAAPVYFGGPINASLNGNASTATILQTSRTINGIPFNGSANIVIDAETPNVITFASLGGDAPGTTFDGSFARTISYATVGAPSVSGTGATGTWAISITGNSATATSAVNATTSARLGTLMSDVSTSQAVVAGSHYNVIATAVAITLPASPAEGDTIFFTATATNWTINRNGKYIMGLAENMLVDVSQKITFGLKFVRNNSTNGWMLI